MAGNYFFLKKGFRCDEEFPAFDEFDELKLISQDAKVFVPSCLGPETVYSLHKVLKGKNVTISRDILAKPGHRYNTAKVFALLDPELNVYFDDEPLLISNPEEKYDAIIIYRPLLEEKFHFTDAYIRYSDQLLNDQGLLFAYVHSNYAINSENKTKLSRLKDELNLQMTIIATWEKCNNMVSNKCLLLFSPKDLFEGFVLIGNPICGFDKPVSEIMKTRKSNNCTLIKREDLAYPWLMETNIKPNCFEPLSKYFNIYEGTVPNESIFPNGSTGGSGHILTLVKNGKKMELAEGVVPFSEACYCSFYSINYEGAKIYFDGSSFKWDYCYGHGFVPCKGILILETNESAVFECHEDHDDVSKWFDYVMNYFVNPEIEKIHDLDYPLADLIRIIRIPTPKQFRSYEHKSYCSNRYYNIQDKDTIEKLLEVAYSGDVTSIEKDHSGSLVQQILEYNADLYMIAQSDVGNPLELRQLGTYKKSAFAAIRNFEQMIQKLKRDRMSLTDRNEGKHTTDKFLDDQLIRMQRQLQDLLDEWDEISDDGLLFSTESIRETLLKEMKECNEHIESLKTKKTKEISEAERIEQRIENLQNQSMCVINDLDHIDEEIDKICGGQYL